MKAIIDNKMYDTEKANLIHAESFQKRRDYYKTEKGTYFCHSLDTATIHLVDENTIKDILAQRNTDKYIELFGSVEEG